MRDWTTDRRVRRKRSLLKLMDDVNAVMAEMKRAAENATCPCCCSCITRGRWLSPEEAAALNLDESNFIRFDYE